jgi:ParB family chromosome partitioning protein
VDRLTRDPHQPRTEFDEEGLRRLAQSLKDRGQLQPIRVRWDEAEGRYAVVIGERRWRAAQLAGLEVLACVVMTGPAAAEDLLEDQLIENCLREDLKPIEQARAYRSLMDSRGLSQRQLAERLQIGHPAIAKALALLHLPDEIQESVERGEIAPGTAYELSKVEDFAEQTRLAREAAAGLLKRDEIQERTRSPRKGRGSLTRARKITSQVIRTATGPRVTVEFKRGLDDSLVVAALEDALGQAKARLNARAQAQEAA